MNEKAETESLIRSLIDEVRDLRSQLKDTRADVAQLSSSGRRTTEDGENLTSYVADNVGVVGLKEVLTWKQTSLKVVWGLLILLGATATAYYIYKGIYEFLNKEAATKISIQRQASYDLPDLIICPPWWFDTQKAMAAGLSANGLKYALFYANLPETYVGVDSNPEPCRLLTPGAPTCRFTLDTFRGSADYWRTCQTDFHGFYARQNFSSLQEFYAWLSLDIAMANVTSSTGEDDEEEEEEANERISDERLHLAECSGCAARPPEKILFSNAVCYLFHLDKATPKSVDQPITLQIVNQDATDGLLPSNAWSMDFASNVGPRGPCVQLKPYFTYNIKLSAQRQIMMVNETCCVDTERNKTYDQRMCTEICISTLKSTKTEAFLKGTYSSFAVSKNLNDTMHIFDSTLKMVDALDTFLERVGLPTNTTLDESDADAGRNRRSVNETVDTSSLMVGNESLDDIINSTIGYLASSTTLPTDQELIACYQSCLPPCDRVIYDMSTDRQEMEAEKKVKNQSIIQISVRHSAVFQGGIITWQEVTTTTFSDFVSNVGGTLGLFLGCTVLTLAQLILSCVSYGLDAKTSGRPGISRRVVITPKVA